MRLALPSAAAMRGSLRSRPAFALGLLLCLAGAWLLFAGRHPTVLPGAQAIPIARSAPEKVRDPARIAAMFGVPLHDAAAKPTAAALILLASGVASDPSASSALIAGADGVHRYRIGQPVGTHGRLRSVAADHVVILRNGREELLAFARPRNTLLKPYQARHAHPAPSNSLLQPYRVAEVANIAPESPTVKE